MWARATIENSKMTTGVKLMLTSLLESFHNTDHTYAKHDYFTIDFAHLSIRENPQNKLKLFVNQHSWKISQICSVPNGIFSCLQTEIDFSSSRVGYQITRPI